MCIFNYDQVLIKSDLPYIKCCISLSFAGLLELINPFICKLCHDRPRSNDIFILDLTPGFTGLVKDNYTTRRETFHCYDVVYLILEAWWWIAFRNCSIQEWDDGWNALIRRNFHECMVYWQYIYIYIYIERERERERERDCCFAGMIQWTADEICAGPQ